MTDGEDDFLYSEDALDVVVEAMRVCVNVFSTKQDTELVECADDELFDKVLINSGHVLYSILPRETVSTYAFRRRRHNRELISKTTHLAQCSIIVRMLYKDMY